MTVATASKLIDALARVTLGRRNQLVLCSLLMLAVLSKNSEALAAEPPADAPVSVVVQDTPPPSRVFNIAFSPLPLVLGRATGDVVIAPFEHHAIVLSPSYTSVTTAPITTSFDANGNPIGQLPQNSFSGWGGELGYRYYVGDGGLRGAFVGPVLFAQALNGSIDETKLSYWRFGAAVDVGYQRLVADRVSLGLGLGLQVSKTSKTVAAQQFPAALLVQGGVLPRFLLSLGVAL